MDNMAQLDIGQVLLRVFMEQDVVEANNLAKYELLSDLLDQTRFVSNEFIRWHKERYFLEGNRV